ncbi:Outer membrane protein assembly factor BamB [Paenibacillus plantiphilus]|uniref:Outer membrane protein assembly factor BamB n=1 Tax=Paenibacillus plantiphilus TaxID=2905650 RepID=A0ABM9CNJ0_9BACL|nr:Outer membrane protein assembly factor BamB [Paenibacillus plantiphilus]
MNNVLAPVLIAILLIISGCSNNGSSNAQTGVYPGKAIEGVSGVAWALESDFNGELSGPLVTEATTYFSDDQTLYAVDTKTGEQKWTHQTNGGILKPVLVEGIVSYIDKTGIHALRAQSGELVWERERNKDTMIAMSVGSLNHILFHEILEDGRTTFKALNIETGKESWSFGERVLSTPIVVGDKLYIPSMDQVHVLNEKSGKEIDIIEMKMQALSIAVRDNLMIAEYNDFNRSIHAFDLKSHDHKWEYVLEEIEGMGPRANMILLDDKVLLTYVRSGEVVMLDGKTGKELWKKVLGTPWFAHIYGGTFNDPIVAEDTLYISVWEGQNEQRKAYAGYSTLFALDVNTGNEQWRYQEDDFINYSPSLIDNGMVIVTNNGIKAYKGGSNVEKSDPAPSNED